MFKKTTQPPEKTLEIKVNYWETVKPNHGRVSTVRGKISPQQLERIMAVIHETEQPDER